MPATGTSTNVDAASSDHDRETYHALRHAQEAAQLAQALIDRAAALERRVTRTLYNAEQILNASSY